MAERDYLVIALIKEVLGPRNGPNEILPIAQNPRDEYITGVLAPAKAPRPLDDIEADTDEIIVESDLDISEETSSEEDQDTQGYVVIPGAFSPALNPKDLPRSIGLSFTVDTTEDWPQIEVCSTWARYHETADGWQRHPTAFLTGAVKANQDRVWDAGPGVKLQMRSRKLTGSGWRVSLFLVNTTSVHGTASVADHLFQPQIRVHCVWGTTVVPVQTTVSEPRDEDTLSSIDFEEASLSLLYRGRTAMARGHLCGAIWKDIDPERPHFAISSPEEAPFAWTDASVVPEEEREKFSPAHVRTELVPCYPIEAPEMVWDTTFGPLPEFNPGILAETWLPSEVQNRLQPLINGYQAWIAEQQANTNTLTPEQQGLAFTHLQSCQDVANRMQQGIDLLIADEDVRLAFCFANKAIAVQSEWTTGDIRPWRSFQLAFILLNIPALADPLHPDRGICDLLWFPTGGGKTEAYLGLAAFTLALRRRRSLIHGSDGVGVLSRYTLRLLTIQQFRRALGIITASEFLRVQNLGSGQTSIGWRPHQYTTDERLLWGSSRFAAGLWVGGGVTPNNLHSIGPVPLAGGTGPKTLYVGALDILQGAMRGYDGPNETLRRNIQNANNLEIEGEPAQVLNCPACSAILAIPDEGLGPGQHTLHFVFQGGRATTPASELFNRSNLGVNAVNMSPHGAGNYRTLSLTFTIASGQRLSARDVDQWWYQTIAPTLGNNVQLQSARPARPGYFILTYLDNRNNPHPCDFDIYCSNPRCILNQQAWAEAVPLNRTARTNGTSGNGQATLELQPQITDLPDLANLQWQDIPPPFRKGMNNFLAERIPIPAYTVDDQVYHRCPSLVIATVDKFARLAYEPKASALFGAVDHYHSRWGYYREGCPPLGGGNLPPAYRPHPAGFVTGKVLHVPVPQFQPPDLILQDELHLIEGPLGSMVGLYETAVEILCQRQQGAYTIAPKYVASTATVRQAEPQVKALFDRQLAQFPPPAVSADDRFFARDRETHPLQSERPGRLYVAVCAPGKGPLTPIVRIWSVLLQTAYERGQLSPPAPDIDQFYTLAGYFNAIRELAGAVSLYRQDIPERLDFRYGTTNARPLPPDRWLELSGRASSLDLPTLLERLQLSMPNAQDAVFTTSMFGTGVDVTRLGLMVVHGQPKTTASYIQATGRVGREHGGLVVTFLRASRPRDLDHYEFFTGYHRALYRYVEPITVAPFSPRARERALGPLSVILLRHAIRISGQPVAMDWRVQQRLNGRYYAQSIRMQSARFDPEVVLIPELLEARASQQPNNRRPLAGVTAQEASSELDRWRALAESYPDPDRFVYHESALVREPQRHVVLGDPQHRAAGLEQVCENAPQSLREVEETTGFKT